MRVQEERILADRPCEKYLGRPTWPAAHEALVNAADDPPFCDFILPAVVRRGKIVVAASTGGTSPAMARRLREDLSAFLTPDYEALADLLAEVRVEVRAAGLRVDPETWSRAIDEPLRDLLREGRTEDAHSRLIESLGVSEALTQ